MKNIYGVNSVMPINTKLKNGYTMYDWIVRQKGFPKFCMRTLSGENKINKDEIEFLRNKDCKIGLVIRDLSETIVSGNNGIDDASRAVEIVKELGVPSNESIAIFAEVGSDWSINHNWMITFAQTLFFNGYIAGFIANTDSSINFNFDRQCGHFVKATSSAEQFDAIYCATEPKRIKAPENWEPYCPSVMEPKDIKLWSCRNTSFDKFVVDDVYAINEKVLDNMW